MTHVEFQFLTNYTYEVTELAGEAAAAGAEQLTTIRFVFVFFFVWFN